MSFETAELVFDDPRFLSKPDWHPDGDRYHTLGRVGPALLLVVHTLSEDDDPGGRIISARKATPRERKAYEKETSKSLTREQLAELEAIAAMPDSAIDTSDAPEVLDWTGAKRGAFYRPIKQQLTLRLDADIVAWFKTHTASGRGYQTRINQAQHDGGLCPLLTPIKVSPGTSEESTCADHRRSWRSVSFGTPLA